MIPPEVLSEIFISHSRDCSRGMIESSHLCMDTPHMLPILQNSHPLLSTVAMTRSGQYWSVVGASQVIQPREKPSRKGDLHTWYSSCNSNKIYYQLQWSCTSKLDMQGLRGRCHFSIYRHAHDYVSQPPLKRFNPWSFFPQLPLQLCQPAQIVGLV